MKLKKLQLENFRNYNRYNFDFSENKNLTIIIGPNGKGKTNLLEAIYVLSLGKSFRTILQDDLIEWNLDYMRCKCEIENNGEMTLLEVFYTNYPDKQKNFKKNNVNLKNKEYIGSLITVLFHPEDLNILYLSPSYRRKYMDILLSQTDKKYLSALINYKKALKQRNSLLYEIRSLRYKNSSTLILEKDLDIWDEQIVEFGSEIIKKRIELMKFLNNKTLENIYKSISSGKEKLEVKYFNKIEDNENLKEEYSASIASAREKDILYAKTSLGPHRDDIIFFINGKRIASSASRGEFRTLLLAMKLAEITYIKEKTGTFPVLLLDDVFSELDRKRQSHLLESIKDCQTIITATDIGNIDKLAKESEQIEFVNLE